MRPGRPAIAGVLAGVITGVIGAALAACNVPIESFHRADAAAGSDAVAVVDGPGPAGLAQQAYVKASNTGAGDSFGQSVALSADGSTLAVSAFREASRDGNQADDSAGDAGAVYVFTRTGTTWSQQAYVKASNAGADDLFGTSVALSADGSTLAVGAFSEDSKATGVGGDQNDEAAPAAGAAYVFTRTGTTWSQQAYVKPAIPIAFDQFGVSVALSADGSTLAVGASSEASADTNVGKAYVFARTGSTWTEQLKQFITSAGPIGAFGNSVALSADGSTLAVGASREDSPATSAGALYVLTRSGTTWHQDARVVASHPSAGDRFGQSVALSADGTTVAVGASAEDSAASGVDGDQTDESAADAGAVYLVARGATSSQAAYVKPSNPGAGDGFGLSVALSGDGLTLAVGAAAEDSRATGIAGDQTDDSAGNAGAAYVFR